jgi:Spy/CpxP family protein refolding chaperone
MSIPETNPPESSKPQTRTPDAGASRSRFKPWMKRSLIGVAVFATLLGGAAAWAQHRYGGLHGPHMGWHTMSAADAEPLKARMVDKIGRELDLDAAQKAKLASLADQLREGRNAFVTGMPDPRVELRGLVAGPSFDRSKASALVQAQVGAMQTQSPAVINAMADFYDSLKPEQQARVRAFMARRGPHGGQRGGGQG